MSGAADAAAGLRTHQFAGIEPGPRLIVNGAVQGNKICDTQAIDRSLADLMFAEIVIRRALLMPVPARNPLAYLHTCRCGERNRNRRLQPTSAPAEKRISTGQWASMVDDNAEPLRLVTPIDLLQELAR